MTTQLDSLQANNLAYMDDPAFNALKGSRFVPGSGPLCPDLMLVGEAPGKMENAKGIPFVGSAGTKLNQILIDVGIDPYNVYMTNAIKYWPRDEKGRTRTPTEEELRAARSHLQDEIDIVRPKFVGLLGRSAMRTLYPGLTSVRKMQGQLLDDKFVPLFHPANILYNNSKKTEVEFGFFRLKEYLNG